MWEEKMLMAITTSLVGTKMEGKDMPLIATVYGWDLPCRGIKDAVAPYCDTRVPALGFSPAQRPNAGTFVPLSPLSPPLLVLRARVN